MRVTKRSSSAVCIDWFISVICRTTFADIFPSFSIRKVSCNLCRAKMRSDDKVICKEQIQLFRLYPCHLINLTYCFFCCTKFEVWCCGLICRASYSKYFDRSVFQILCDLRDHFCRTYDCCCRTVTFPVQHLPYAGNPPSSDCKGISCNPLHCQILFLLQCLQIRYSPTPVDFLPHYDGY